MFTKKVLKKQLKNKNKIKSRIALTSPLHIETQGRGCKQLYATLGLQP